MARGEEGLLPIGLRKHILTSLEMSQDTEVHIDYAFSAIVERKKQKTQKIIQKNSQQKPTNSNLFQKR